MRFEFPGKLEDCWASDIVPPEGETKFGIVTCEKVYPGSGKLVDEGANGPGDTLLFCYRFWIVSLFSGVDCCIIC